MKKWIWKILIILGLCTFAAPFVSGLYMMWLESWTMTDWVILYSFVYWPTYLLGIVLIFLGIWKLMK